MTWTSRSPARARASRPSRWTSRSPASRRRSCGTLSTRRSGPASSSSTRWPRRSPETRTELSEHAPRITTVKIDPEQIGLVIGKGGETIRSLEGDYEVQIDIEEDGTILIYATDGPKAEDAIAAIQALTKEPEVGDEYTGKVVKTTDFGAFVELKKGTDGLLHVSNVGPGRVAHIEDVISRGDVLDVKVAEVDKARGRIGLKLVAKHENGGLVQPEELIERAKSAPPREREERPRNDDRRGGRDRGRRDRGPRRES